MLSQNEVLALIRKKMMLLKQSLKSECFSAGQANRGKMLPYQINVQEQKRNYRSEDMAIFITEDRLSSHYKNDYLDMNSTPNGASF